MLIETFVLGSQNGVFHDIGTSAMATTARRSSRIRPEVAFGETIRRGILAGSRSACPGKEASDKAGPGRTLPAAPDDRQAKQDGHDIEKPAL